MAATWTYNIEVTNIPDKIANVTATRTDGTEVRTYTLPLVPFAQAGRTMGQIREEIAAAMYALYTADKARSVLLAAITNQEALLASATNVKEV